MSADLMESAFIGAILHSPAKRVLEIARTFSASDLGDPGKRLIFELALELAQDGVAPDPVQVMALARNSGRINAQQSPAATGLVIDWYTSVPIPAAISYYARAVIELSVRRRIIEATTRLSQAADASSFDTLCDLISTESGAMTTATRRLSVPRMAGAK